MIAERRRITAENWARDPNLRRIDQLIGEEIKDEQMRANGYDQGQEGDAG
jgi:hypothetical protein